MSKKFKIKVLKGWICRTPEKASKFNKLYKKATYSERLKEQEYSYINNNN